MEGEGFCIEECVEALRKDMLTGMLLHMVKTRFPLNNTIDFVRLNIALEDVKDLCVFL
jgi:hypothetical protein